jgi:glycosyltransferase involved in cell wall biosynthesis
MSSGVPVVASDIPVHREICAEAAVYFEKFSPTLLADRVAQVAQQADKSDRMVSQGLDRARQFSWKTHVEQILGLFRNLTDRSSITDDNRDE